MQDPWVYIVLLGAFAVVSALALPRKVNREGDMKQAVRNMEVALEQFMENMEADNEELVESLTKAQNDWREEALKRENKIVQLERRCSQLEKAYSNQERFYEERLSQLKEELRSLYASAADQPETGTLLKNGQLHGDDANQTEEGSLIRDRYAEIVGLHEQGKSIEYIAKKSGLNKGEVQLILQLSRQEEQHFIKETITKDSILSYPVK